MIRTMYKIFDLIDTIIRSTNNYPYIVTQSFQIWDILDDLIRIRNMDFDKCYNKDGNKWSMST